MRVLEILSDSNRGGAGVYLENYAANASPDTEIVAALPQGAMMAGRLRRAGAQVVECALHADTSFDRHDVAVLRTCIETFAPDVVHTHGSLSGRIAARLAGRCKTVYTKHTLSPPRRGIKGRAAAALDNRVTDAAIAVSRAAQDNLLQDGLDPSKVFLIYNGITGFSPAGPEQKKRAREALGIPQGGIVAACVARLEPVKNHRMLLEAFAQAACGDGPPLTLLLCGDGSLRQPLEALAARLPGGDNVLFLGEREDVAPVYAAADFFVLTSHSENMPLTVLEAMSAGLPALLTDVGGMSEAARENETALFTAPQDRQRTARALRALADDGALRLRLGAAARARFEQTFTAQVFARQTDSLYRKLVTGCEWE